MCEHPGPQPRRTLETHQSVLGLCLIIEMILYYAVLYRRSNPTSQMGKPFEGKGIFCIFVATRSSAPQAAACPETSCCLLADKLDVGCKSDVLDCICREAVSPTGSMPAQTLLHRQGRVIPSCSMYLSRITEAHSPHCPSAFMCWLCHRQRDGKIMSFLYNTVL